MTSAGSRVAIIGAGELASAVVSGLGLPVAISDNGSGRAARLAASCQGRSGANEVISREAIVFLAHPVSALHAVAASVDGRAACVVSLLSGVRTTALRSAYASSPVVRATVTIASARNQGVVSWPDRRQLPAELDAEVAGLLSSLGVLFELDEAVMTPLISLAGVAPAYYSLLIQAQVDAAIAVGVPAEVAMPIAIESASASVGLLAASAGDTAALRRSVATPGGRTARGLAALENAGLHAAFENAARAVVKDTGSGDEKP